MPTLVVRRASEQIYYEAKFRFEGRQVLRRIGPAWLDAASGGGWEPRRGRVPDGYFDERRAHVRAAEVAATYVATEADRQRAEAEAKARPITFRELAADYLMWLEFDYGAKPTTLKDHRYKLAEAGTAHLRGDGTSPGRIMGALGDFPAAQITREQVRKTLNAMTASGMSARNVNKHRNLLGAIFNHGVQRGTGKFSLLANPCVGIQLRREPKPAPLVYFMPEEIEAVARAMAAGSHRTEPVGIGTEERERRSAMDVQDAEAVRLAAYTGVRRGELVALRWRDVDWTGAKLTVSRAMSAGVEGPPKSGSYRDVPLSDQAAAALERLSRRTDFSGPEDLVLCNSYGRHLDPVALGRRYNRARNAAGLRPLRWHDLRHTFGSLLVAAGVDTVSVKAAMGHERITTTERYLHARPATTQATAFTAAFRPAALVGAKSPSAASPRDS